MIRKNKIMENIKQSNKINWFSVLVLLAITVIILVTVIMALQKKDNDYQFTVSATGKVTAVPDIANIRVGVHTDIKSTAADAVKANTNKMNEIIEALKNINIKEKDITTSNYSLNPVYDWTDKRGRKLKGYEVRQTLTVKIRDLDNIGKVIQVTTKKGANQIGGVTFTIDDPDELKKEAFKIAIAKAKAKAKDLVAASGLKIGKLINVYESQSSGFNVRVNRTYAKYDAINETVDNIPEPTIEVGEQEVSVEVTLVFEVK